MPRSMNMESLPADTPEAVILAYQMLVKLNLELHKPEVEQWLHSEEAEPALKKMLADVPCPVEIH